MILRKLKNGDIKISVYRIDGELEIILTIDEINMLKNSIDKFINNSYDIEYVIKNEN
jgi:hypothetical protein